MLKDTLQEIKRIIKKRKVVFLIGAGISFPPPSNLTTWPQRTCIRALEHINPEIEEKVVNGLRPEVFFQVLKNVIGERALIPLEIINPLTLNSEEIIVYPNFLHFFLAQMINEGHVVLSTNFDDLIETAYKKLTGRKIPHLLLFKKDFLELGDNYQTFEKGILIKMHGSFVTPAGKNCRETIVAILEQVQKEFPECKKKFMEKLVKQHDFLIMGYSGRDDFDIFGYLLKPSRERKIWWIRHVNETDPEGWRVYERDQLTKETREVILKPVKNRTMKDLEIQNSNTIVLGFTRGVVIEAHITKFIESLNLYKGPRLPKGSRKRVEKKSGEIMTEWLDTINLSERKELLGAIFNELGGEHLEKACQYYNESKIMKHRLVDAKNLFEISVINYKTRKKENLEIANKELKKALTVFQELHSRSDQARTYVQLALVDNRLNFFEEGVEHSERGIKLYIKQKDTFEVARALRALGLIIMRGIPDMPLIIDASVKKQYKRELEWAIELCKISVELFRKIGNKSGQRGEGQSLNIMGLLQIRFGNYEKAIEIFNEFLDLSNRSRFLEESFQGYRNLAMSQYNLSRERPDKQLELLNKCLNNYKEAIEIKGGEPSRPTQEPKTRDEFNTRYNRSIAKKDQNLEDDLKFALQEFNTLLTHITKIVPSRENWHWKANILTRISEINSKYKNFNKVKQLILDILQLYRSVNDGTIERQPFGIQNAKQNLISMRDILQKFEIDQEIGVLLEVIKNELNRINKLKLPLAILIHKDWSKMISSIQELFLKLKAKKPYIKIIE